MRFIYLTYVFLEKLISTFDMSDVHALNIQYKMLQSNKSKTNKTLSAEILRILNILTVQRLPTKSGILLHKSYYLRLFNGVGHGGGDLSLLR